MGENKENKITIEIVVKGKSYGPADFPEGMSVEGFIARVLANTKNTGQPPANWDARDSAGNVLDRAKHLKDCGLKDKDKVWVDPKTGAAGR